MRKRDIISIITVVFIIVVIVMRLAGFSFTVILTDSMEPTVNPMSLVVTAPPSLVHPKVGDIILYKVHVGDANYTIMHRAVANFTKDGQMFFITKGDNRKFPDLWRVPEKNVIGVYVFSIPKIGYIIYILLFYHWLVLPLLGAFSVYVGVKIIIDEIEAIERQEFTKSSKLERVNLILLKKKKRMVGGRRGKQKTQ